MTLAKRRPPNSPPSPATSPDSASNSLALSSRIDNASREVPRGSSHDKPAFTLRSANRVPQPPQNTIRYSSTAPVQQPIHAPRQSASAMEGERGSLTSQIAKNLILARHALGVTQETLAFESRVSRATIAQIESGVSDCRIGTLADIARALGISLGLLFLRPDDIITFLKFVRPSAIEPVLQAITPQELDSMNRLSHSGLQKDLLKSAKAGIDAARSAGYKSPGAAVGAGLGTAVLPGAGTAAGTILGVVLDNGQNQAGSVVEDGAGI